MKPIGDSAAEFIRVAIIMSNAPPMPKDCRVDWFRVFADLSRIGISMKMIEENTGVKKSTLLGWKLYGYSARLEDGLKIIRYWMKQTGKPIGQLPIENIYKPVRI